MILQSLLLLAASVAPTQPADTIAFENIIRVYATEPDSVVLAKAAHVVPTPNQLAGLDREFIGFVHVGPNTFTKREWGTGMEDPKVFDLKTLDTDQWARSMRDAGIKLVILTAKHHDGFVLWQSRYTNHGIMSTDFEGGKGDIMRSLSNSLRKYGLKMGVYLSPADLYQIESPDGLYGNGSQKTLRTIPKQVEGRPFANTTTFEVEADDYNEYFMSQLFELLTEYGEISEVWFDGAHPKQKGGQTYNNIAWRDMIRKLAPNAVIFGRQDVRWCGNEGGDTRATEWNVIPYEQNPLEMANFRDLMDNDLGSIDKLRGDNWLVYQYPETDTSIRDGWFYRDEEQRTRPADEIFDIYERTTGGNSVLLLNVPPTREGVMAERDVKALAETGRRINATYGTSIAERTDTVVATKPVTLSLDGMKTINRVMLKEPIGTSGERVAAFKVEARTRAGWQQVAEATNIGHKRIVRFPDTEADSLRVIITESRATPSLSHISAHRYVAGAPALTISRGSEGKVVIVPTTKEAAMIGNYEVRYTTNGSEPTAKSKLYTGPFATDAVDVRAVAFANNQKGEPAAKHVGYPNTFLADITEGAEAAFDYNPATAAKGSTAHVVEVIFTKPLKVSGITYTPPRNADEGLVEAGELWAQDKKGHWKKISSFELGNIKNDPSPRDITLSTPVTARALRFMATKTTDPKGRAAVAEITVF